MTACIAIQREELFPTGTNPLLTHLQIISLVVSIIAAFELI
jgi:hypothetical protein